MDNQNIVKCHQCGIENSKEKMFCCLFKGQTNYECIDEKSCKDRGKPPHPKKEYVYEDLNKFGIEFDDLEEVNMRFRDYSKHYYHPKTDKFYSHRLNNDKLWIETDENLSKTLRKYI
jgi:hypothetical protein